jgi:UDP-N-acetylmuramoyl-tripeptide--D-alanyl-D-alanine ligase
MLTLHALLIALSFGVAVVWGAWRSVHALHMLQLDSYLNVRLLKWLWARPLQRLFDVPQALLLSAIGGVALVCWALAVAYIPTLALGAWCCAGLLGWRYRKRPEAKKPLVYTSRAKRILALAVLLELVLAGVLGLYAVRQIAQSTALTNSYAAMALTLPGVLVTVQLAPLSVTFANLLLLPLQCMINAFYLSAARRKLRQFGPTVVGITGSYGKTSTKYFLHTMLSERFCTLKTPQSFNTMMGICRVINDELQPQHQVFIVEMGAYSRGVIRKLANFVRPQIGVLTAIGPQHLERFKTLDNIEAAKYELIEGLPPSGIAVFNSDDLRCRKLADRTQERKVLRYGLDEIQAGLSVWAADIVQSSQGASFTLVDSNGHRVPTHTALLGRHNVLNIVGAACVALEMGVSVDEIARAIPNIEPAPHRLQLLQGAGGVTVIDDSYNSNPLGAAAALETLQAFNTGKRVLVTPGMVELGAIEVDQNEQFGINAARVCDYVLLVGPQQTQAILRGLKRQQFPSERIRVVQNLTEATSELQRIVRSGDVILFENDLPDLYVEV